MKNNNGFSIVIVLASISVVVGLSYYVMGLNRNSKVQSAMVKNTSFVELERRRISAVLSDNETCKTAANFGGQSAIRVGITSLNTLTNQPLVTVNTKYYNDTLTLSSIQTRINPDSPFPGTSKQYEVVLNYLDSSTGRNAYIGKKQTLIRIPMFMNVVGGLVSECYAITENNEIDIAIKDSCSPVTPAANINSYVNTANGSAIECQRNVGFAAGSSTDCPLTPTRTTALGGFDQNISNGTVTYNTSRCTGITAACPAGQTAHAIVDSNIQCDDVGSARDPVTCSPGEMLYHSGGTSTSCVSADCTVPLEFVQSMNSTSETCYSAPATTCPPNQYVYIFDKNGTDQCKILPAMSGSCAPSNYGDSITRATTTVNGTLNCSAYNKAKSCGSPSPTTYMTGTNASGAASCSAF